MNLNIGCDEAKITGNIQFQQFLKSVVFLGESQISANFDKDIFKIRMNRAHEIGHNTLLLVVRKIRNHQYLT